MVLFEAHFENNGEGKSNGLTIFKQKEVRKTVVTRANIGVKLANKVLDKERDGRRNGAVASNSGREEE